MNDVILNIAGGKIAPDGIEKLTSFFLINVDTMYYSFSDPGLVENKWRDWSGKASEVHNIRADVFEFLERTIMHFDKICIYRFLEHIPMDKVLYFIYLLSTVTNKEDVIDVIVPNYKTLAKMILEEDKMDAETFGEEFAAHNILLTTELLNETSCPHASVWTAMRAQYFFELEGRFRVTTIDEEYDFDGRDIYMRFQAERL